MSKPTVPRLSRSEIAKRLKSKMDEDKGRVDFVVSSSIAIAQSLGKIFDDYVAKELSDLGEEIELLEATYFELGEEKEKLKETNLKFEETNQKLVDLLHRANEGKITSMQDFDFSTVLSAWGVIEELLELKTKIYRFNRKHIRDTEAFRSELDELLKQRGL